jgi:hypothetical protein
MPKDKIFFEFQRMEPLKWPEPRDIRVQLEKRMVGKYKDQPISKILFSTEFILKSIKPKDGSPEKPLLKYKVVNIDWEDTREIKDIKFDKKMFKWTKGEENEYEDTGAGAY